VTQTILIVDDSPTAAPELRALLDAEGYSVLTALSAEEALDTLKMTRVDLIISEALLPRMSGFEFIRQVRHHDSWSHVPIIVLSVRSAPEDYAAGFEAGADDYFNKPLEPHKLIPNVRKYIAKAEAAKLAASQPPSSRPTNASGALTTRNQRGQIITIFSLKGGVGTSTIAVNLAVAIKNLAPSSRVGLIDFSLEEGIAAILLDVVPTSTIADWAREDLNEATPYLLNQYFVQHRSGISLMSAPPSPEQAELVKSDIVRTTLTLAPDAFDYILLDTASTFSENTLVALEMANAIVLPVTPDIAALKTAVNTQVILKRINIPEDKITLVLNEIIPRAGLNKSQVETSLGKKVVQIPHAGSAFIDAVNQGMPPVSWEDPSPSARALIDLARTLCEPEVEDVDVAPESKVAGLLGRLRRV
jgi:pilus assembly protein CpaE